jgi:RecA/RadA recombinase
MVIVDSLGNLHTEKAEADAIKSNNATDMGLRARTVGLMMSMWIQYAAVTGSPVVFTNHVYDDPNAMFDTIIKKQGGGRKVVYNPSLVLQLSATQERAKKDSCDVGGALSNIVLGSHIRALTTKNRFAKEFLEANIYLSQENGMSLYSGLLDFAKSTGIITATGSTYVMGTEKIGYSKNFELDADFWDPILSKLDKAIRAEASLAGSVDEIPLDGDGKDVVEFNSEKV